jgi:hypothetical protein
MILGKPLPKKDESLLIIKQRWALSSLNNMRFSILQTCKPNA